MKEIDSIIKSMSGLAQPAYPSIGLDLDGTIDEFPIFFQILAKCWPGDVYVITYRNNKEKAEAYLQELNIQYDHLIMVASFPEKAEVVKKHGIAFFFDDQDEVLRHMPLSVGAFKVRNEGNFDFDTEVKKWIYSRATGREI